jgi:LDH2 family malate/lactate/ureidoglycolate dehydrogenase
MTTDTHISIDTLREQVYAAFAKSGVRPETAQSVTDVIVAGERDNCKSHGIYRSEGCLRSVASGKANPTAVPVLKDSGKAII